MIQLNIILQSVILLSDILLNVFLINVILVNVATPPKYLNLGILLGTKFETSHFWVSSFPLTTFPDLKIFSRKYYGQNCIVGGALSVKSYLKVMTTVRIRYPNTKNDRKDFLKVLVNFH